jgi:hypothetical protein
MVLGTTVYFLMSVHQDALKARIYCVDAASGFIRSLEIHRRNSLVVSFPILDNLLVGFVFMFRSELERSIMINVV